MYADSISLRSANSVCKYIIIIYMHILFALLKEIFSLFPKSHSHSLSLFNKVILKLP